MRLKSMFSVCLPNDLHPDEFEAVSIAFLYWTFFKVSRTGHNHVQQILVDEINNLSNSIFFNNNDVMTLTIFP